MNKGFWVQAGIDTSYPKLDTITKECYPLRGIPKLNGGIMEEIEIQEGLKVLQIDTENVQAEKPISDEDIFTAYRNFSAYTPTPTTYSNSSENPRKTRGYRC